MLDMMMLVGPGGQERTEQDYGTVLRRVCVSRGSCPQNHL